MKPDEIVLENGLIIKYGDADSGTKMRGKHPEMVVKLNPHIIEEIIAEPDE